MAELTSEGRERLPDSAFACPERRLYPHHKQDGSLDLPHLRNALSRIGDPSNDQCGKAHLEAHARAEGIGDREAKALMPAKAQVMPDDELDAWLEGRIPRRILAVPFGGPIPDIRSPKGVDLDGEWFDEPTDIFGPHRVLRQTRERLSDWSHAAMPPDPRRYGDPTGMMSGHVLGKSIIDPDPEEDGWWADHWFERGNQRVRLIGDLIKRKGATLFGSSQPATGVSKAANGFIKVWPHLIQTLTTAPQNTYSVLRPKAALDVLLAEPNTFWSDIESAMRSLGASLRESSADRALIEAKAGRVLSSTNETDLREALDAFEQALGRVRSVLARQPEYTRREEEPPDE